jgi:PAS domain S-box-containing protein
LEKGALTTANETMQASMEAHFGDALAAMRQPFVIYDRDERLIAYNAAFADLHRDPDGTCILQPGLTFQALTEWRLRTGFFRPATLPDAAAPAADADYYQAKGEVMYQLRDGRWILVERHALPRGQNIGLWIDITALKNVEARLRETALDLQRSQEQLTRAQRIAHIGSDERDLATGAVTWSDEAYQIFGVSRETYSPARENLVALVHPDERAAVEAVLEKSTVDYAPARDEFRIIRPDGAQRIIVRHSEVVFDAQGHPLRRIGTIQDVTDTRIQEKLEHDLQRAVLVAKEQAERGARTARR